MAKRLLFVPALVLALLLGACGDDDGAGVRDIGSEEGGSPSGSGSGPGSGSGSPAHEGSPSGSPAHEDSGSPSAP